MMSHVSTASGVIDLNTSSSSAIDKLVREPIYEDIIDDIETNDNINNNSSNYSSDINTNLNNSKNNNNIISNNDHSNSVDKPNSGNDLINDEPYYQVPKSCEPYYEIPKPPKPVPLYENVDIFYHPTNSVLPVPRQSTPKEPPKEKPPPPPVDEYDDDDDDNDGDCDENDANHATSSPKNGNTNNSKQDEPFRRINSTRRIKNEIRTQRSSFLGLPNTNNGNHNYLELSVAPPPDMMTLLKEEKRIEKQLYMKAGIYDNSDSGVSENHSRQSSELFTSSEELDDINSIKKDERNTNMKNSSISNTDTSSNTSSNYMHPLQSIDDEIRMQCIEEKIREQEEVLRVERELLQLEQEELKRQRENLLLRENYTRRGLDYNNKVISTVNRRSMTDINDNGATNYMRIPQNNLYDVYQVQTDFRKSMPDLQNLYMNEMKKIPPSPPAKPMRAQQYQINHNTTHRGSGIFQNDPVDASQNINYHSRNNSAPEPTSPTVANDYDEVVMRNVHSGNMTKHTIHALSAVPKPKYTDVWVQQNQQHHHHHHQNRKSSYDQSSIYQNALTLNHNGSNNDFHNSSDMLHKKEKSKPASIIATGGVSNNNFSNNKNYNNKHWLIQEAEQRRIEQQQQKSGGGYNRHSMPGSIINYNNITNNNSSSWINNKPLSNNNGSNNGNSNNKPLPDSIIQTLTHIVQSRGIGERKNLSINQNSIPNLHHPDLYGGGRNNLIRHSNSSNNISSSSNYTVAKSQENIVSVSGKKKCSYCNEELGRGAAMVIESLRLFYHIDCFKCCVCGIKLGDGLNGTDVRVRNHKLHCHNCYSSDDGVKFSCV